MVNHQQYYPSTMDATWWVEPEQLDDEQGRAVALPASGHCLITGPPGSGKSNLLLLRATHLHLSGERNFTILVFTSTLKGFLAQGHAYDFPLERITTYHSWARKILRENDKLAGLPKGFDEARAEMANRLRTLSTSRSFRPPWNHILVDEGQDYSPVELDLFFRFARKTVYIVGDGTQSIYFSNPDWSASIESRINERVELRHNYRNGLRVCELADGIGQGILNYVESVPISRYDEKRAPSSVDIVENPAIETHHEELVRKLTSQLDAYGTGHIGVLVPKRYQIEPIYSSLRLSSLNPQVLRLDVDSQELGTSERRILLGTIHAAKGLEFRAVHLLGMHDLKLPQPRRLSLVGVTRAKTSLVVYKQRALSEFLDGALSQLLPPRSPALADLFAKRSK